MRRPFVCDEVPVHFAFSIGNAIETHREEMWKKIKCGGHLCSTRFLNLLLVN